MNHPIKLGSKVKDVITGFEGIASSCVYYLTGCTQIGVSPTTSTEGNIRPTEYLDYQRLEVIGEGIETNNTDSGGPQRDAPAR